MKWLAFTAIVVTALVALGVLAVNERDVEWEEGRQPHCPHCRAKVETYSVACAACDRTFDWEPNREPCQWCLSEEDVELLQDGLRALELKDDEPLPSPLADFTKAYLFAIEAGACTFCGGLGNVVSDKEEVPCPVCRGGANCVACAGRRTVTVGAKPAHLRMLERARRWAEAKTRAELTRMPLRRGQLVDEDVEALTGFVQTETLVDENGRGLLLRARAHVRKVFAALHEQVNRHRAEKAAAEADGNGKKPVGG